MNSTDKEMHNPNSTLELISLSQHKNTARACRSTVIILYSWLPKIDERLGIHDQGAHFKINYFSLMARWLDVTKNNETLIL